MKASAVDIAYTKPLHTAATSKAALPLAMPSFCCTMQAVLGKLPWKSGVELATITRSTSPGALPAISSARRAACTARSDDSSSAAAKWRASMPLRVTIHSCEVSTPFSASWAASCSLVTRLAGR